MLCGSIGLWLDDVDGSTETEEAVEGSTEDEEGGFTEVLDAVEVASVEVGLGLAVSLASVGVTEPAGVAVDEKGTRPPPAVRVYGGSKKALIPSIQV